MEPSRKRFGKLIGVLEVCNSSCRFLVYAVQNREILTESHIEIENTESDDEFDAVKLWDAVQEAIRIATQNLQILEIAIPDIIGIGITNQRETSVLWNKNSGEVFNLISSGSDSRLDQTLSGILSRTKNKKNFLRSVCGLPFDVCFSAIKIKYLIENNTAVKESIKRKECLFGNLDSWILWNLTGGVEAGVHCTDVTNASRTMLMNLESLSWDENLLKFFNIPIAILPQIRSCSEIFGYIKMQGANRSDIASLENVPIASVIGSNNSALVGQMCFRAGQIECNFENDCSVLMNTGQEIIFSDNDLLTTVGFKLGPNEKVHYAIEGFIGSACSSINWLQTSIVASESNNNDDISPVSNFLGMRNGNCFKHLHDNDLTFVPALKGLCAPNFLYQAKGFLSGLTINTSSQQLLTAAKESICFQTKTILDSIKKDCKSWPPISNIIVGGEFSDNVDFLRLLTNICTAQVVERPQISAPSALGCMFSAALTMKTISLDEFRTACVPPVDSYYPSISQDASEQKYMKWLSTLKTSLQANGQRHREEVNLLLESKDSSQFISNSIPGCLFLFTSYVIYVLSQPLT